MELSSWTRRNKTSPTFPAGFLPRPPNSHVYIFVVAQLRSAQLTGYQHRLYRVPGLLANKLLIASLVVNYAVTRSATVASPT